MPLTRKKGAGTPRSNKDSANNSPTRSPTGGSPMSSPGRGSDASPRKKGNGLMRGIKSQLGGPVDRKRRTAFSVARDGEEEVEGEGEGEVDSWDGSDSDESVDPNQHRLKPWFLGTCKYIVFIVTFTFIQIGLRPTADMRQFTSLWDLAIGESLSQVVFIDNLWTFLNGPVVSLVSSDYFQDIEAYWPGDENAYIYGNRRMGQIRIRQVRVKGASCQPTQTRFIQQDSSLPPVCYPQYSLDSDEGLSLVWKNTTYTRSQTATALRDLPCDEQGCLQTDPVTGNLTKVCCTDLRHFNYIRDKDLNESTVPFLASRYYWGGGYVVDLVNETQARRDLHDLRYHQDWIDLKTRAVFVDFSFYNANLDLFVVARLVVELLPSGKCLINKTFRVIQLNRYSLDTNAGTVLLACQLIMSVMLMWYTVDLLMLMYADIKACRWRIFKGLKLHFSTFWNAFDFIILLLFYVVCGITGLNELEAGSLLENLDSIDSSSLQTLGFWATQERNMLGVLALVVWLKIFRYVTITVRLERLFMSLARATPDLITYLFLFALWMYAFSVAGILMFGNELDEFADAGMAILTCNRVMFGEFDFDGLYRANRVLGWMWLFGFSWTAIIILLNFFVAILCEVYAQVMEEYEGEDHVSIMDSILNKAVKLLGLRNSAKQVAALEEKFTALEQDEGGVVSKVMLQEFLAKEGAFEIFDTTEVTEVMARFDKSGDGRLQPEEMKEIREVIKLKKKELEDKITAAEQEQEEGPR
eukprot:CAMPEP_0174917916 /NCGR_PEP_ID=MMETSP1355-20121228/2778_1 /TAXON_ID=464990 /ORGANISM="Hemiselmis tepida, Strain CCMP443" /LENGTH=752 /DNA_ID=CAMNT_0016163065 /DNA_START=216 /DNA_END=2470 /DNA_ORIENTATION=-